MTYEEAMRIGEWFLYKQCDLYCTIRATKYTHNDIWKATNIAFKSLENAEKYKWHDLRKDPMDLPHDGERIEVCVFSNMNEYAYNNLVYKDAHKEAFLKSFVGWRYKEPFEGDEE